MDDLIKPIQERLLQALTLALEEGLHKEKVDPKRVARLRVSSFPFCGVRWFLQLDKNKKKVQFNGSRMNYYTKVGHVLHQTMQDGLLSVDITPFKVEVICDWVCQDCKTRHFFLPRISQCAKCSGFNLKPEEHEIDDYPLMGHVDNIFRVWYRPKAKKGFKDEAPKFFYVVIDYKTSSFNALSSGKLPYKENCEQLRAYANEIRRRGNRPVAPFVFLVYVPRDNPGKMVLYPVSVDFESEETKRARYVKRFNEAVQAKTKDDVLSLVVKRPCKNELKGTFKGCKHAQLCAGPDNSEMIEEQMIRVYKTVKDQLPIKDHIKG